MGREKYSLSKKIKNSVKGAVKYINNFEKTAADLAIENEYDYVVCGHIHQPKKEVYENKYGSCTYLNSGDWVENLTALEYSFKRWKIYHYNHDRLSPFFMDEDLKEMDMNDLIASITDKEVNIQDVTEEHLSEKKEENIETDFLDDKGLSQDWNRVLRLPFRPIFYLMPTTGSIRRDQRILWTLLHRREQF